MAEKVVPFEAFTTYDALLKSLITSRNETLTASLQEYIDSAMANHFNVVESSDITALFPTE